MRLKNPRSLLIFYAFVQVTWAYHHTKYADNIKNSQRTNPKKYHPSSVQSVNINHDPHQLRDRKLSSVPTSSTLLKNSDRTSKNSNNKLRYSSSGHPVRHRHGWMIGTTTTTTTTTPSPEEELFNNYGDFYDGDYLTKDDYSEDVFEATNNDFYDEFQSEEPSTSTERTTPAPHRLSDFGDFKYKFLGTREKVRQARADYLQSNDVPAKISSQEIKSSAAAAHYLQVQNTGKCHKPILKVIPVHIEHPNSSVTYTPHCTVLHRCAEDTGCCENDATCQFKKREEVTLYFYVRRFGIEHPSVEKLTFFNHTECECRRKLDERIETPPSITERGKRVADFSSVNPFSRFPYNRQSNSNRNEPQSLTKKCKCPKEFVPKVEYRGKCTCDCDLSNEDCLRMKRGREYSSLIDRQCIENQECGTVLCQFGPYNKSKGRCPKFGE